MCNGKLQMNSSHKYDFVKEVRDWQKVDDISLLFKLLLQNIFEKRSIYPKIRTILQEVLGQSSFKE